MNSVSYIHPLNSDKEPPQQFTYPYCYTPHPLVLEATDEVRCELQKHPEWQEEIASGKMFGVLICKKPDHDNIEAEKGTDGKRTAENHPKSKPQLYYLAAFSGTLDGKTIHPFFVPPVYDLMEEGSYFKQEESEISKLVHADKHEGGDNTQEAATRSIALQRWLFSQYRFLNIHHEEAGMFELFADKQPPSGTGDCCAPKLLQTAYKLNLHPLCMGEFWMGQSPKGEIRQEGHFYPACSGKCKPLLHHMLEGLDIEPNPLLKSIDKPIRELYHDDTIVVIEKPSGMLSVPGKDNLPNVQEEMRKQYPQAEGPLIVHRLDMDTSGIMVLALTDDAYHHLQEQFVKHQVKKRYTAILEHAIPVGQTGRIDLPICPDITDRPRQMVHEKYGRRSITEYKIVGNTEDETPHAIIHLWPHTGRTHQLRVHCAHQLGLHNPIMGDRLYGTEGQRLMLHAAELTFTHPTTGETMHFETEIES